MKCFLSTITFMILSLMAYGQSFNPERAIDEISNAASSIKTMQCDFTQTKTLKLLGEKMVSKGNMVCEQPNKLRWEYVSPYTYTFILNGANVLLKSDQHSQVIDVNQNKMFKEIARIMMNSVLGKCLTDKKDFIPSVVDKDGSYIVTLLPQKKEMKQMFTNIVLTYDKKQAMVVKVELHEKNGDFTLIDLHNIKKNSSVNASMFQIN